MDKVYANLVPPAGSGSALDESVSAEPLHHAKGRLGRLAVGVNALQVNLARHRAQGQVDLELVIHGLAVDQGQIGFSYLALHELPAQLL